MVLNMLSTGAMVRLGHVYGNLMVNVQPKNEKLVNRACRIISAASGVSYAEALALLEASGRTVKTAIVMGKLAVDREEAESALAKAGGRIRQVLQGEGK